MDNQTKGECSVAAENKILQFFPQRLRGDWERCGLDFGQIQEIRLRVNQPVKVFCGRERTLPFRYGEREMEEVTFAADWLYPWRMFTGRNEKAVSDLFPFDSA